MTTPHEVASKLFDACGDFMFATLSGSTIYITTEDETFYKVTVEAVED